MKKDKIKLKNIINYLVIWCSKNILTLVALSIAIMAYHNANKQFKINYKNSDTQFRTNLNLAKSQFDSISMQLETYRRITENQLKIADEQLKISKNILDDQIYSGRPIISIGKIEIKDKDKIISEKFAPKILIPIENKGKRSCYNLEFKVCAIVLNKNFSFSFFHNANELAKEKVKKIYFLPKLEKQDKDNFYLYLEVNYEDNILQKKFKQSFYYHYEKRRNEFYFYDCEYDEKEKIKDLIK